VSVFDDQTPASDGKALLAGPGDGALYASGTLATFDSWTGTDPDAVRVKHTEQVVVRSAASCASLLGAAIPSGTFCTVPASGPPDADPAADQCWGDAGGALLTAGKLIGISATKSTACVQNGVRLYTKISSYAPLIGDWSHDVDADFLDSGSVVGTEPSGADIGDICTTDLTGTSLAGCAVDSTGTFFVNGYNLILQEGDADGDGQGDLLIRTTGGTLYRTPYRTNEYGEFYQRTELGTGWNAYNRIIAPRDISGDGYPDVLARDSSGVLWRYDGTGTGRLSARTRIGGGWNQYTVITGRGDLSGDGRPDLVARDTSGVLWLYRGTGKGGFAARTRIGGGWNQYKFLVASGDIDHNGRQDFLGVTTSGAVYLYNADNEGGFAARKLLHSANWSKYKSLT
jgi:hypothetical protein